MKLSSLNKFKGKTVCVEYWNGTDGENHEVLGTVEEIEDILGQGFITIEGTTNFPSGRLPNLVRVPINDIREIKEVPDLEEAQALQKYA